ncbi:hypothetical protein ACTMU2_01085 [Cupriavidus basilensis]
MRYLEAALEYVMSRTGVWSAGEIGRCLPRAKAAPTRRRHDGKGFARRRGGPRSGLVRRAARAVPPAVPGDPYRHRVRWPDGRALGLGAIPVGVLQGWTPVAGLPAGFRPNRPAHATKACPMAAEIPK